MSDWLSYGKTLVGLFSFEEDEMYMGSKTPPKRGAKVPMPSQVAGTITFHKHEGVIELSGVGVGLSFLEHELTDKVLEKRERKLEATTDIGCIIFYECGAKTRSFSNNGARVLISFRVAFLKQSGDGYAERGDELSVIIAIDTSNFKSLVSDHIETRWDESALGVVAEHKKPLSSTQQDKEGYHLQAGWSGATSGGYVSIRRNLCIRRTWKWGGDIPIWKDVYERVTAIRSVLAVLLGHVPNHLPLVIQAKDDKQTVDVGKMLICAGYKDAKEAPDDQNFLINPHADGDHFVNVIANWSQRHMEDDEGFRVAVHWAEWSTIFRPTTEHALVNTWMACSKLGLEVSEGKNGRSINHPLGVELNEFDSVLVQAKWCRNYIEHGRPNDGNWNYQDSHVLAFLRDTVDFYFYAHVLGLCGWDVKEWQKTPPLRHPMGEYVRNYERNYEYAQQTTLKPR